jgi:hypothetical protein
MNDHAMPVVPLSRNPAEPTNKAIKNSVPVILFPYFLSLIIIETGRLLSV